MYDIIIIGGGPSGMTAALYAKRSGKSVLIIEKESFGGQIASSPKVENYPSVKEISGLELANNMFDQIMALDVNFECDEVTSVSFENDIYTIYTPYTKFHSKSLIIATGLTHKRLPVMGLDQFEGKGVSYCAVCDGAFYKDQDVCVIGDANTALQYAIMLSETSTKVTLCMLFDHYFAEEILVNKLESIANIEVIKNVSLKSYNGDSSLESLTFTNTITNEEVVVKTKACFIAIGQEPHNEIYKDLVDLDDHGFIISPDTCTKTKGLFAVGDCRSKKVKQVTTAVGDGAMGAMNAVNYVNNL